MTEFIINLIDDDPQVLESSIQMLNLEGHQVEAFSSAAQFLSNTLLTPESEAIIISDIKMPQLSGLELLDKIQNIDPDLPVILITGHADVEMAIDAMKRGGFDFIQKPVQPDHILDVIKKAKRHRHLILENRHLRQQINNSENTQLIGLHESMQHLKTQILNLGDADVDVLINGQTGSGKELVANALHQQSKRKNKPFVALNCGAIPNELIESELFGHEAGAFTSAQKQRIGKIESANNGTLFLDEIESMPINVQIKLLRVLQDRCIQRLGSNTSIQLDFRIITASKINLHEASQKGEFRDDLLYRLDVATIEIPALNQRGDDILILFKYFSERAAQKYKRDIPASTTGLEQKLLTYDWPGNVRECQNLAEKWILGVSDERLSYSTTDLADTNNLDEVMNRHEKYILIRALDINHWKITKTAEYLGIPRKKLYLRMQKYQLKN